MVVVEGVWWLWRVSVVVVEGECSGCGGCVVVVEGECGESQHQAVSVC